VDVGCTKDNSEYSFKVERVLVVVVSLSVKNVVRVEGDD
jgi:hypothetical protein